MTKKSIIKRAKHQISNQRKMKIIKNSKNIRKKVKKMLTNPMIRQLASILMISNSYSKSLQ
jgi:hypothetical protein